MENTHALLRIYTDEEARKGDHLVYETIVARARESGLAGATVLRGVIGLGSTSHMHKAAPFQFARNLPVVVEIVDDIERLRGFSFKLDDLHDIGLITIEPVEVLRRR